MNSKESSGLYQCPFGLRLHFYHGRIKKEARRELDVSMPFRAGAPFLLNDNVYHPLVKRMYQCPLGLMLHFYVSDVLRKIYSWADCINALSGWDFISTYVGDTSIKSLNEYPCPFGLRLHLYKTKQRIIRKYIDVSMPFRAGVPFLRYPFQNLGFMRFLEPIFAGIYQNILTMAFFRAC